MGDEKEVVIRITAKNLTGPEFAAARKEIAGLGDEADRAKKRGDGIGDSYKLSFSKIAAGATIALAVVTAVTATLIELGQHGAEVSDIRNHFDALNASIGNNADTLRTKLRSATAGTISDFDLMKASNIGLSQGLKLNEAQFELTGKSARIFADRVGGDAKTAYETLIMAMTTGQDRQLKQIGLNIDAAAAVEKYAASLGVEKDKLSEAGEITAKRNAILEEMQRVLAESGEAEIDFADNVDRARTFLKNQWDELSRGVAESPVLAEALNGVGDALASAFGGDTQGLIKMVVRFIEDASMVAIDFAIKILDVQQSTAKLATTVLDAASHLPGVGDQYKAWGDRVRETAGGWQHMRDRLAETRTKMDEARASQDAGTASTNRNTSALRENAPHIRRQGDELAKARQEWEKYRAAFDGTAVAKEGDKILRLVQELGGAHRLTESAQKQHLATLMDLIAQHQALGKQAKPEVVALAIELDALLTAEQDAANAAQLLGQKLETAFTSPLPSIRAAIAELERLGKIQPGFETVQTTYTPIIPGSVIDTTGVQAGKGLGGAMIGGLRDTFSTQFGPTIMAAITGGGNIGQAVGGLLGQSLTTSLAGHLARAAPQFMSGFLGQMLGSFLPGIGALLGPLLGKVGNWFKGLFGGVSEEVKKARTDLEAFQKQLDQTATATQRNQAAGRDWALMIIRARDAMIALGMSADEADQAAQRLAARALNTDNYEDSARAIAEMNQLLRDQEEILERNRDTANSLFDDIMSAASEWGGIPDFMRAEIEQLISLGLLTDEQAERLRELGDANAVNVQKMEEAMGVFQGRLESLGPAFAQAKLDETSKKYVNAIDTLIKGGADVGGVLFDAREELSALASESLRTGRTLPANMKPWIEELHRAGLLVDENGNKLEDISGIKYGEAMKTEAEIAREGWQKILDKIQELIERITGPLQDAIDDIPDEKTIRVRTELDDSETRDFDPNDPDRVRTQPEPIPPDSYASGSKGPSGWFRSFGTGTLALLHDHEAVVPRDRLQEFLEDEVFVRPNPGFIGRLPGLPVADAPTVIEKTIVEKTIVNMLPLALVVRDRSEASRMVAEAEQHMASVGIAGNLFGLRDVITQIIDERIAANG